MRRFPQIFIPDPAQRLGLFALALTFSASPLPGQPPPNDDFESATEIEGLQGLVAGTTVGATSQAGEPDSFGPAVASVWWRWTAPENRPVRFSVYAITPGFLDYFPMRLAVYSGSGLGDLTIISWGHPEEPLGGAGLQFLPAAGGVYWIVADVDSRLPVEERAECMLNWRYTPENDLFRDAFELVGLQGSAAGTNGGATLEYGEPLFGSETASARERWGSVWWKWTAPADAAMTIHTFGSGFDTKLGIYTGDELATLTEVAANDDSGIPNNRESILTFNAVAGVNYKILVDGFSLDGITGERGEIVLNWEPAVRLFDISSLPGGVLRFTLECSPGAIGYVQRSSDLETWADWRPFRVGYEGRVTIDAQAGEEPGQYYRCRIVWP
jgi:hypothetical protein